MKKYGQLTLILTLILTITIFDLALYSTKADVDGKPQETETVIGTITVDGKSEVKGFKIQESVIFIQGQNLTSQKRVPNSKDEDEAAAIIDQKGRIYSPHVVAVEAGSALEFRNSDPELHNVHATCKKNIPFNIAMIRGVKPQRRSFPIPEIVKLSCNVHRDMLAYIVVLNNPYFAMPNDSGNYEIANVPSGNYTISLWHEKFEEIKKEITVESGKNIEVNFNLESAKAIRRR